MAKHGEPNLNHHTYCFFIAAQKKKRKDETLRKEQLVKLRRARQKDSQSSCEIAKAESLPSSIFRAVKE